MARKIDRVAVARSTVAPLTDMPRDMQDRIAQQVAQPKPPAQWIAVGPSDSPRPMAWIPSRAYYEWYWERGIDPDSRRESLPPWLRQAVIERDGYICQLCGIDVEPADVHVDHIHPYSKGGKHVLSNLQVTHSRCNMKKGARV